MLVSGANELTQLQSRVIYRYMCYTVNMVLNGYKYRFYLNAEQVEMLAKQFGCVRYVYNRALALRIDAYRNGEPVGFAATGKALTSWKRDDETEWLSEVSSVPLQQALAPS